MLVVQYVMILHYIFIGAFFCVPHFTCISVVLSCKQHLFCFCIISVSSSCLCWGDSTPYSNRLNLNAKETYMDLKKKKNPDHFMWHHSRSAGEMKNTYWFRVNYWLALYRCGIKEEGGIVGRRGRRKKPNLFVQCGLLLWNMSKSQLTHFTSTVELIRVHALLHQS